MLSLLQYYQEKLHRAGDAGHDEELNYVKDILASPIFQQFLVGRGNQLTAEEASKISEASSEVLTGINVHVQDDGHLSPSEQRKRQIARRRSLKMLRNVVTPKSSPIIKSKRQHRSSERETTPSDGQSPNRPLRVSVASSNSVKSGPLHSPGGNRSLLVNGGGEATASGPYRRSAQKRLESPNTLQEARARNLSNSSSTLIERPSPVEGEKMRKKSSDSVLVVNGGLSLGSQPNMHKLGLQQQARMEPSSGGMKTGSSQASEWNSVQVPIPIDPMGMGMNPPASPRPPPPSYHSHMHQAEPEHPDTTLTTLTPHRLPPPPPYGHQQHSPQPKALQSRAKSVERLFQPPLPSLHGGNSVATASSVLPPPPPSPLLLLRPPPATDAASTQALSTAENRSGNTSSNSRVSVCLAKGEEGLGFKVMAPLKNGEHGLFVQELQPGGVAER